MRFDFFVRIHFGPTCLLRRPLEGQEGSQEAPEKLQNLKTWIQNLTRFSICVSTSFEAIVGSMLGSEAGQKVEKTGPKTVTPEIPEMEETNKCWILMQVKLKIQIISQNQRRE